MRVNWRGDNILNEVKQDTAQAIDETMVDCVAHAQLPRSLGGAPRLTGQMANSLTIVDRAADRGGTIKGTWGGPTVGYTLYQELKVGFLRRAADRMYPELPDRIREIRRS